MNNEVIKLLKWLGEQYQFKPGYKKEDPETSFRKMDNWFNRVYITLFTNLIKLSGIEEMFGEEKKETVELTVPKTITEFDNELKRIAEQTAKFTTKDKEHPDTSGWFDFRRESVIILHQMGKTVDEIAAIVNTRPYKVREILNKV